MEKVRFQKVSKKFKMYSGSSEKIKGLFRVNEPEEYYYALRQLSFRVDDGQIVGIIGLNGSGKSTLSNLISGVTMPSSGNVEVNGSAALIAISSGLNNNLTGMENIELKGLMIGLTKKQIKRITPDIIKFADVGKFIYQPVKTYSSGMKSRLGFAISVNIDPDILVIDEALSVGDPTFTKKCLDKMNEFKDAGKTIFFISHSLHQIKNFCNKALWLHYGQLKEYGEVEEVVDHYSEFLNEYNKLTESQKREVRNKESAKQNITDENSDKSSKNTLNRRISVLRTGLGISILCFTLLLSGFLSVLRPVHLFGDTKKESINSLENSSVIGGTKKSSKAYSQIQYVLINNKQAGIWKKPNKKSEKIGQVQFGSAYKILGKTRYQHIYWYKIELSRKKEAWISSSDIKVINIPEK